MLLFCNPEATVDGFAGGENADLFQSYTPHLHDPTVNNLRSAGTL
jgi:hypothetical protein